MSERWRKDAAAHAAREYPREACGLLIDGPDGPAYVPCRNVAAGVDHFILPPEDYAAAEDIGDVVGVVHSHPNAPCHPSAADRFACERSGVPWHVIGWPSGVWGSCAPNGERLPLIGREFAHGVVDCYTLIRDWYAWEAGIALPDFLRTDDWWQRGENLYVNHFADAGFRKIEPDQALAGDVILMAVKGSVPNHGAVLLEGGVIIHHFVDQLSGRAVYGGYWRKHTTHFLRHKERDS